MDCIYSGGDSSRPRVTISTGKLIGRQDLCYCCVLCIDTSTVQKQVGAVWFLLLQVLLPSFFLAFINHFFPENLKFHSFFKMPTFIGETIAYLQGQRDIFRHRICQLHKNSLRTATNRYAYIVELKRIKEIICT